MEQALQKERCNLNDSGIECRFIRIIGNSLYVAKQEMIIHGSVQNSQFCPVAFSDTTDPTSIDSSQIFLTDSTPLSNSGIHVDQPVSSNNNLISDSLDSSNVDTCSNKDVHQST